MKKGFKIFKKILKVFVILIILIVALLYITGNGYVIKGVQKVYFKGRTTANIFDYNDFDYNVVENSPNIQEIPLDSAYNQIPLTDSLLEELKTYKTTAFLVLKNGKIWQEYYWNSNEKSRSNSFSMAKTITTLLTQKAIEDGYIKSWNEPITDFLPEYKSDSLAQLCTIADLSRMTSGFDWKEDYYFPINPTAKAYYDDDMDEVILNRKFVETPNNNYKYLSGNTQLLGYILQRSLKGKTISQYLSEKFWKPMGMDEDAYWTVDHKDGIEKTYCCIHSDARNFSKFGLLLMAKGKWKNNALIDSTFVKKMETPNPLSNGHYGYGLWTDVRYKPNFYFMRGHLGQYVICIPEEDVVIVRLGELRDDRPSPYSDHFHPQEVYIYINETLKSLKKHP